MGNFFKDSAFIRETRFILFAHVFNPLWRQRDKRRIVRCIECYRRVESYLSKYRDFVKSLELPEFEKSDNAADEKIFSIWFQGEDNAPELVKICFQRLRNVYGDRFVVLDDSSLSDWIELPEHVMNKWKSKKISHAHFSDICRVELLYRHGGMWFDATDYLTSPVPRWIEESDLFIYGTGVKITPEKLIQSCFMRAAKGHPLFAAWREFIFEYWRKENKLIDYFLLHYMIRFLVENNTKAHEYFYAMEQLPQDPTHLLWHKHRDSKYSDQLYLECTKDTFFQKTTFKCKSAVSPKPESVADYIINNKIPFPYGQTRISDTGA